MKQRGNVHKLWLECRAARISFVGAATRYAWFKLLRKNILTSNKVTLQGVENVHTGGLLMVGMPNVGFTNRHDRTFLHVRGALRFEGAFSIGRGCRFDIGPGARATFGKGYVAAGSTFIIMHALTVGEGCAISWGCQFLDDDFHSIDYAGREPKASGIVIGANVWIGSNVSVLKGAHIADGCVVASGSVVTKQFSTKNALIGGNPARILRHDVRWK